MSTYINGNAQITIDSDGTRTTTWPEGEELALDRPRQADVKLTNWCNMSHICTYCHESSNLMGRAANVASLLSVLREAGPGVEWAFGGGSTLSHPHVIDILRDVKDHGQIANVTVNQLHLRQDLDKIEIMQKLDLVKGVGLSIRDIEMFPNEMDWLADRDNIVVHLIAGINHVDDIQKLNSLYGFDKFLVLGYKTFGMGVDHYSGQQNSIEANKLDWKQRVHKYFGEDLTVSFDNLGLQQLDVRRWLTDDEWKLFYQGDDDGPSGSMYIDGVEQTFAPTSRSRNRVSFDDVDILEYFKQLHVNNRVSQR